MTSLSVCLSVCLYSVVGHTIIAWAFLIQLRCAGWRASRVTTS